MLFDDDLTVYLRGKMFEMLSRRMYSHNGLRDKIVQYVLNTRRSGRPAILADLLADDISDDKVAEIIDNILIKMTEQGLLNDLQYAKQIVNSQVFRHHRSLGIAKMKLRTLKLSDDIIEEALESIDLEAVRAEQIQYVQSLLDKALNTSSLASSTDENVMLTDKKVKQKLINKALRRGIPYDVIGSVLG